MSDAYEYANPTTMRLDSFGLNMSIDPNVAILKEGRDHKWWLSARLLLGMSEQEADQVTTMGNGQLVQLSGRVRKMAQLENNMHKPFASEMRAIRMMSGAMDRLSDVMAVAFDKTANDS